jgi:hypothetical protein
MRRRVLLQLAFAGAVVVVLGGAVGVARLKRYVDSDPGLCAHCHRASPEFAVWTKGSHRSVACQRCHHATPEEGLAMLRAFLAGKSPDGAKPHARVEVGACAACHLSHDPQWKQIEGSRGHQLHVGGQHIACVTCHAAGVHGFEPVVTSCKACHGEHAVRATGMAKLHCFACHNFLTEDPGLRPTRRDCLRCHRAEGVVPARFADDAPMQFDCGECHKPHARSAEEERAACSGCHRQMQRAGLHALGGHRTCSECHVPHVWRTDEATGCVRCHGGARVHARGRACAACHGFAGAGRPIPPRVPERGTPAGWKGPEHGAAP